MYNLRSRGRVTYAGSFRPHLGMGVRALPAVAGQVTPSQAIATYGDEEIISETEMLNDDDAISDTFDDAYAANVEATQPPILTQMVIHDLIYVGLTQVHLITCKQF